MPIGSSTVPLDWRLERARRKSVFEREVGKAEVIGGEDEAGHSNGWMGN